MSTIELTVNGQRHALAADPGMALLDALRDMLGLVGTRQGCGAGECGACHVLLDGRSVALCTLSLDAVAGQQVTTVEGLEPALAEAFVAEQAAQCGYCSSGMLIGAAALLRCAPQPSETQIRAALDAHLCRCGAHPRIIRAVQRAARSLA